MQTLARRTRSLLSSGPMKRADLLKQLGVDSSTWVGVGLWVDLVRASLITNRHIEGRASWRGFLVRKSGTVPSFPDKAESSDVLGCDENISGRRTGRFPPVGPA